MQMLVKVLVSLGIILFATAMGRRYPSAAGLIGVMPLTGALVLVWVYVENRGDPALMQQFTKGALWGIVPSILFFLVAYFCFLRSLPLHWVLVLSFAAWSIAALVHQALLR